MKKTNNSLEYKVTIMNIRCFFSFDLELIKSNDYLSIMAFKRCSQDMFKNFKSVSLFSLLLFYQSLSPTVTRTLPTAPTSFSMPPKFSVPVVSYHLQLAFFCCFLFIPIQKLNTEKVNG